MTRRSAPLVCLGEALVDLICPDPVADGSGPTRFEVRFGGALSNVALAARRAGAEVALAGGAGDDPWGRFLRERLAAEGVDLRFQAELADVPTPFAFATLDDEREPSFDIHGAGIDAAVASLTGRETEIAEFAGPAGAICFGSNTCVAGASLGVTRAVRDAALAAGVPLLFDPNLRPGRWKDLEAARARCIEMAEAARVLKCNREEARWLAGYPGASAAEAAEALLGFGSELVVVTAGPAPLAARGICTIDLDPPETEMVSPLGAGDVFMGVLAAQLIANGWARGAVEPALRMAAAAGAEACGRLGAFES